MDATEKHGAIARNAGSRVLVTEPEAHRTEWKRALRIILNVLSSGSACCGFLGDNAEELLSFASLS